MYFFIILCICAPFCSEASPRIDLTFPELASYDGYTSEIHTVETEDDYILTVHRLPPKETCAADPNKIPIVYMHGMYESSDDCLIPGPGVGHCYIYAESCYDVWVPNSRGNFYSRSHKTYNPDEDVDYWDFDIDEMALKDLPVIIDYILDVTGSTQLGYVAHAQGVALLLILCAKQPQYNDKFNFAVGLSSTTWLNHAKFSIVALEEELSPLMTLASDVGLNAELFPRGGSIQKVIQLLCGNVLAYPLCSSLIFATFGYNKFQITPNVLIDIVGHAPSGTSLKNFNRWGQMKKNGFAEYDFGEKGNLEKYGQAKPPLINLGNVTMQWIFLGSENDNVSDLRDLDTLMSYLSNASKCVVSDKSFIHLDFIYSKNIPKYITPVVLSMLNNKTYECL